MKKLLFGIAISSISFFCSCKKDVATSTSAASINVAINPNVTPKITYTNAVAPATHGTFTMAISFSVTANGSTAYIPSVAYPIISGTINNPIINAGPFLQYGVENGSSFQTGANAVLGYNGTDVFVPNSKGNYVILPGQTKMFTLIITFTPSMFDSYRAEILNINFNGDNSNTYTSLSVGLSAFATIYVAGN